MDVRSVSPPAARSWLWFVVLASSLAGGNGHGGGKLRGGGGGIAAGPPVGHINAVYPPPHPPCHPVTKLIHEDRLATNYVTIYSTLVEPVVVPTTFYHISYVTSHTSITKFIYSTVYNEEIEYDSSVAVGTDYISVTDIVPVPTATTVTNIKLKVVPSVVTTIKGVTVGSAKIVADTTTFTRTFTVHPTITETEIQHSPYVTTSHTVVTHTQTVSETVTVTEKPPPLTSTILNTEVQYTPVYVTQTISNTVGATVTEHQRASYTVTVHVPCGTVSEYVQEEKEEEEGEGEVEVEGEEEEEEEEEGSSESNGTIGIDIRGGIDDEEAHGEGSEGESDESRRR